MKKLWFSVGLFFFLSGVVFSQTDDSLLNKTILTWKQYAEHHRSPVVFLHLDKSIYKHTEYVQFMAYQLGWRNDTSFHILYVFLTDLANKKVGSFDRFALYEGVAAGALYLPDSLKTGEYLVTAYTGEKLNGLEQPLFRQQITVLPDFFPPFLVTQQPDTASLRFRVTTDYQGLASGGSFRYRLQADGRTVDSGNKKIDAFGEVDLGPSLHFADAENIRLTAAVTRNKLNSDSWLPVIAGPAEWRIRYYPEGGDLVAGRPCQLALGVRDRSGAAVRTSGQLLEDGQPVADFQTDGNGWGRMMVLLRTGHTYTAAFPDGPKGLRVKGTFPLVRSQGYTLHVPEGVVRSGDSVDLLLYFPAPGMKCRLLVYNDKEVLYASVLQPRANSGRVYIPVKDWPSGLLTMTLFDEGGWPVAERKLYSPGRHLSVTVTSDSAIYHTRSKVVLTIRATDEKGEGISSVLSLSSVLASRLRPSDDLDIVRYAAIDQYLPAGPLSGTASFYGLPSDHWEDDSVINLLLLTRGWTHYYWGEVAADSFPAPAATLPEDDYGYVLYNGKRPKTPANMLVFNGTMLPFQTDSAGGFRVPFMPLLAAKRGDLAISVAGGSKQDGYEIVMLNKYDSLNSRIAHSWYVPALPTSEEAMASAADDKNSLVKTLQKVYVTPHGAGSGGIEGCRDYVCMYGILNCGNHPYGTPPQIGRSYMYRDNYGRMEQIVYKGCMGDLLPPFLHRMRPVYLLRDVYKEDSSAIPASAPGLFTTLHWSPFIVTDSDGFARISFYTNDLIGRFWNIIEGISSPGALSGKNSFEVIREKE